MMAEEKTIFNTQKHFVESNSVVVSPTVGDAVQVKHSESL